jgi:hypothetical protein
MASTWALTGLIRDLGPHKKSLPGKCREGLGVGEADGRYKKVYGKEPKTPYQRLLDSPDISDECKTELRRRKATHNPSELNTRLNAAADKLLRINDEKRQNNPCPCQGDARPETARNKAGF